MTIINTTNGSGVVKTIAGEEKPSSFPSTYPAPEGYDGWSKLTIDAPDNLIASNIREGVEIAGITGTYGADIKLTTEEGIVTTFPMTYTTPAGYDGMSAVIAHAPENFTADNIRKGVTIANVTGTYEGSSSAGIAALCDGSITSVSETDLEGSTYLRPYAFNSCKALTSVHLPDSIASIGAYALGSCTSLSEVILPSGIVSLPEACFTGSRVPSMTIPDTVTSISGSCFQSAYLQDTLIVPSSVTWISGYNTFNVNGDSPNKTVRFMSTAPPTLTSGAAFKTDMTIIVPAGCLESYQSATNWVKYADLMQEASE